ncbi:restriction endonuclease fold toxin-2 domain-containing protein [Streptomyces sp. NPDC054933]
MAVDAKYVREPGCGKTFRTLDKLQNASPFRRQFLYSSDETELAKYKSAMEYPPNNGQLRELEIDTNDPGSAPYWNAMMVAHGVKGYARYVP